MPSRSLAQQRLMQAAAHSPSFARRVGVPQSVAREFEQADRAAGRFAQGGAVEYGAGLPQPNLLNLQAYADVVSAEMFPGERQNAQRDAARHLIASALAAQKLSPGASVTLGKMHELKESPLRTLGHWLGLSEPRADYRTDVHNNAIGAELGARQPSLRELLSAVHAQVRSGSPVRQAGRVSLEPDADTRYAPPAEPQRRARGGLAQLKECSCHG